MFDQADVEQPQLAVGSACPVHVVITYNHWCSGKSGIMGTLLPRRAREREPIKGCGGKAPSRVQGSRAPGQVSPLSSPLSVPDNVSNISTCNNQEIALAFTSAA